MQRLTPEILGEIKEMILAAKNIDENDKNDDDNNSGTMIVDATCAPLQIKYPQDTALLNEARESTETRIDTLHIPGTKKAPHLPQTRPQRLFRTGQSP